MLDTLEEYLFHEIQHARQAFDLIRLLVGLRFDRESIVRRLDVPLEVVQSAAGMPLLPGMPGYDAAAVIWAKLGETRGIYAPLDLLTEAFRARQGELLQAVREPLPDEHEVAEKWQTATLARQDKFAATAKYHSLPSERDAFAVQARVRAEAPDGRRLAGGWYFGPPGPAEQDALLWPSFERTYTLAMTVSPNGARVLIGGKWRNGEGAAMEVRIWTDWTPGTPVIVPVMVTIDFAIELANHLSTDVIHPKAVDPTTRRVTSWYLRSPDYLPVRSAPWTPFVPSPPQVEWLARHRVLPLTNNAPQRSFFAALARAAESLLNEFNLPTGLLERAEALQALAFPGLPDPVYTAAEAAAQSAGALGIAILLLGADGAAQRHGPHTGATVFLVEVSHEGVTRYLPAWPSRVGAGVTPQDLARLVPTGASTQPPLPSAAQLGWLQANKVTPLTNQRGPDAFFVALVRAGGSLLDGRGLPARPRERAETLRTRVLSSPAIAQSGKPGPPDGAELAAAAAHLLGVPIMLIASNGEGQRQGPATGEAIYLLEIAEDGEYHYLPAAPLGDRLLDPSDLLPLQVVARAPFAPSVPQLVWIRAAGFFLLHGDPGPEAFFAALVRAGGPLLDGKGLPGDPRKRTRALHKALSAMYNRAHPTGSPPVNGKLLAAYAAQALDVSIVLVLETGHEHRFGPADGDAIHLLEVSHDGRKHYLAAERNRFDADLLTAMTSLAPPRLRQTVSRLPSGGLFVHGPHQTLDHLRAARQVPKFPGFLNLFVHITDDGLVEVGARLCQPEEVLQLLDRFLAEDQHAALILFGCNGASPTAGQSVADRMAAWSLRLVLGADGHLMVRPNGRAEARKITTPTAGVTLLELAGLAEDPASSASGRWLLGTPVLIGGQIHIHTTAYSADLLVAIVTEMGRTAALAPDAGPPPGQPVAFGGDRPGKRPKLLRPAAESDNAESENAESAG